MKNDGSPGVHCDHDCAQVCGCNDSPVMESHDESEVSGEF